MGKPSAKRPGPLRTAGLVARGEWFARALQRPSAFTSNNVFLVCVSRFSQRVILGGRVLHGGNPVFPGEKELTGPAKSELARCLPHQSKIDQILI